MSKALIRELYLALDFLIDAGYFDEDEKKNKSYASGEVSFSRRAGLRKRGPRGPETKPREKGQKLYHAEVMEIYKEKRLSAQELADYFGVTVGTIYDIKKGKTWSLLTGHNG